MKERTGKLPADLLHPQVKEITFLKNTVMECDACGEHCRGPRTGGGVGKQEKRRKRGREGGLRGWKGIAEERAGRRREGPGGASSPGTAWSQDHAAAARTREHAPPQWAKMSLLEGRGHERLHPGRSKLVSL